MPNFFANPVNPIYENASLLAAHHSGNVQFNPKDAGHIALIQSCTRSVKESLQTLQQCDKKIAVGFAVGFSGFALSYLFPLSLVATTGFVYGAYHLGKRDEAYKAYNSAVENLVQCCVWSLGEVNSQQERLIAIQDMIDTLAPITTAQQLRDWIDDSVEDGLIEQAELTKQGTQFLGHHLNEEQTNLYYKVYGYQQGGFWAVLEGLWYAAQSGYKSVRDYFQQDHADTTAQSSVSP